MAQTLWLNTRCNYLIDEIMELQSAYRQKTAVVEDALEVYAAELRDD